MKNQRMYMYMQINVVALPSYYLAVHFFGLQPIQ